MPASVSGKLLLSPAGAKRLIGSVALLVILLIWLFVYAQTKYEQTQAISAAIRQNENRAVAFEQYVLRTLEAATLVIDHTVAMVSAQPRRALGRGPKRPIPIDGPAALGSSFVAVNIIDADGDLVATSLKPLRGSIHLQDHPEFAKIRNQVDEVRVSAPTYSKLLAGDFIYITKRFRQADGRDGFVGVMTRPAELINFTKGASFAPADLISIIGLDGITRARRTGDLTSYGENLAGKMVMRMQAAHPNGTYLGPSSLDGIERYFSHRRLPGYALFVTSGVSRQAILAPARSRARAYVVGASIATLALLLSAWLLIVGIARRQRQLRDISAANQRLLEAQRVGGIGDWDYDAATATIHWSDHLRAMYERTPEQAMSPTEAIAAYVGPSDERKIREALDTVLQTGERQEYSFDVRMPSGITSVRQVIAVPTYDAAGRIIGVHGTDQDITAKRRLEVLEAKLTQVSRLDAMNIMASTLAHEINQPLNAATYYLAAGRKLIGVADSKEGSEIGEALDLCGEQIKAAGAIIRTVRETISDTKPEKASFSIAFLVDEARKAIPGTDEGMELTLGLEMEAGAEFVHANRVQIQQVFINLLRNSIEACRGSAVRIWIRTRLLSSGLVAVYLEDNGPGLGMKASELFRDFSTSKPGGLGLGLSIARTIVEGHGGKIWAESSGEDGTTIAFTLPSGASAVSGTHQAAK